MYKLEDYRNLLLNLLPPGRAWRGDNLVKLLSCLAPEMVRLDERMSIDLLNESDPRTASELLGEYEDFLGIPNDCIGTPVGIDERRTRIVQKLRARGDQTLPYIKEALEASGAAVEIEELEPSVCGVAQCGAYIYNSSWAYGFRVRTQEVVDFHIARTGSARAGELITEWLGQPTLECVLEKVRPAHLFPIVHYHSGNEV